MSDTYCTELDYMEKFEKCTRNALNHFGPNWNISIGEFTVKFWGVAVIFRHY